MRANQGRRKAKRRMAQRGRGRAQEGEPRAQEGAATDGEPSRTLDSLHLECIPGQAHASLHTGIYDDVREESAIRAT